MTYSSGTQGHNFPSSYRLLRTPHHEPADHGKRYAWPPGPIGSQPESFTDVAIKHKLEKRYLAFASGKQLQKANFKMRLNFICMFILYFMVQCVGINDRII